LRRWSGSGPTCAATRRRGRRPVACPRRRAAGPLGRLLQGADALLQPGHLLAGGDADRAELAFDLSLEQAAELLAVAAGAPQQVLGDPAGLPGLDLPLLGEQPGDPFGLGAGRLPQAGQRLQVLFSVGVHLATSQRAGPVSAPHPHQPAASDGPECARGSSSTGVQGGSNVVGALRHDPALALQPAASRPGRPRELTPADSSGEQPAALHPVSFQTRGPNAGPGDGDIPAAAPSVAGVLVAASGSVWVESALESKPEPPRPT